VNALYKLVDSWSTFTRYAIIFPERVTTPYFPAASFMGTEGISVGLRYVDLLLKAVRDNDYSAIGEYFKKIYGICKEIGQKLGIECLGIDVSPSPWLNESVCEVVESFNGIRFPGPGVSWCIHKINEIVLKEAIKKGVKVTGFNEVMLSVAEDNLLKKRVLENNVRLRDLAVLTAYCVAGLDMVSFSIEDKLDYLLRSLYDVYAASMVKHRVLGVRLIPSNEKPWNKLHYGEFGYIPIIEV